jgi:hypothetical protein
MYLDVVGDTAIACVFMFVIAVDVEIVVVVSRGNSVCVPSRVNFCQRTKGTIATTKTRQLNNVL